MTYFTELNANDMNEVNGGSIASTLAKIGKVIIVASTVPTIPYWLYR